MDKVVKNMMYVFSADIGVKFLGMFTSFFIAKFLAPAEYGVWITLTLVVAYSGFFHLGTATALLKDGSFYIGQKNFERVREIESGVTAWLSIMGLLLLVCALTLHLYIPADTLGKELFLLRLVLIATILELFFVFNKTRFAIHQDFKYLGALESLGAVVRLVFYISLSYLYGLTGIVFGLLACSLVLCAISTNLSIRQYGRFGFNFDIRLIESLVRIGFPLMIINFIFIMLTSVDRIVSMSMLGKVATGYYGLGGAIVNMLIMIPYALNRVLFPKLNERMGATSDQSTLIPLIIGPGRAFSLILPLALGSLVVLCPLIYKALLPKYEPGLFSAQILILGCFFLCLMRNGASYLIATDRQKVLLKHVFLSLAVNVGCNVGAAKLGYGIEGIAVSTGISELLVCTLIWRSIFASLDYSPSAQWKEICLLYLPFAVLVGLGMIVHYRFSAFCVDISGFSIFLSALLIVLYIGFLLAFSIYRDWLKELYSVARRKAFQTA